MRLFISYFIIITVSLSSCKLFKRKNSKVIAKIYNQTLTEEDLSKVVQYRKEPIDSAVKESFLKKWVEKQVLLKAAKSSISKKQLEKFTKMSKAYHEDLMVDFYKKQILKSFSKEEVTEEDIVGYYKKNQAHFILSEPIFKIIFVETENNMSAFQKRIERSLYRFRESDSLEISKSALKFLSFYMNKNEWLKLSEVIELIPGITQKNFKKYLRPGRSITRLTSKGNVFLIKTFDKRDFHKVAPIETVRPLIRKIITNKKQKEFLEKQIKSLVINAHQYEQTVSSNE